MRDLRAQKLRTTLTIFGIVWGTVAIIVLLAFGMGFKRQLSINMHGIGESIAIMFPGRTTKPFEGFGMGGAMSFVEEDARLLPSRSRPSDGSAPNTSRGDTPVRVGENITTPAIAGIIPGLRRDAEYHRRTGGAVYQRVWTSATGSAWWSWGTR